MSDFTSSRFELLQEHSEKISNLLNEQSQELSSALRENSSRVAGILQSQSENVKKFVVSSSSEISDFLSKQGAEVPEWVRSKVAILLEEVENLGYLLSNESRHLSDFIRSSPKSVQIGLAIGGASIIFSVLARLGFRSSEFSNFRKKFKKVEKIPVVDSRWKGFLPPHFQSPPSSQGETVLREEVDPGRVRPVVITGADVGPCVHLWTAEHLRKTCGGLRVSLHSSSTPHLDFIRKNFKYEISNMAEMVDRAVRKDGEFVYYRSLHSKVKKPSHLEIFGKDIESEFKLPPALQPAADLFHSSVLRLASEGLCMWMHYDIADNFLVQVRGRKRVLLLPPWQVHNLYVTGSSSRVENLMSSQGPDLSRYPLLREALPEAHEVVLEEGDLLFIPALWLHATEAIDSGKGKGKEVGGRKGSTSQASEYLSCNSTGDSKTTQDLSFVSAKSSLNEMPEEEQKEGKDSKPLAPSSSQKGSTGIKKVQSDRSMTGSNSKASSSRAKASAKPVASPPLSKATSSTRARASPPVGTQERTRTRSGSTKAVKTEKFVDAKGYPVVRGEEKKLERSESEIRPKGVPPQHSPLRSSVGSQLEDEEPLSIGVNLFFLRREVADSNLYDSKDVWANKDLKPDSAVRESLRELEALEEPFRTFYLNKIKADFFA